MWEWLDDLDTSGDTGAFDQSGSFNSPDSGTTIFGGTSSDPGEDPFANSIPDDPRFEGGGALPDGIPDSEKSWLDSFTDYFRSAILSGDLNKLKEASGIYKALTGGSGGSTGGGILNTITTDPIGAAFNATPFLLALNEANRQSGDLNNVLNSVNADSYRRAVLDPYDMETGQGRYALQNDLGLRNVAGSSFGNQSLGNYDYMRAIGRGDMASKAATATAQLQGGLINARNTNRNLLLGAGLNASGKLFSPSQNLLQTLLAGG